jgi:hypothetical protein
MVMQCSCNMHFLFSQFPSQLHHISPAIPSQSDATEQRHVFGPVVFGLQRVQFASSSSFMIHSLHSLGPIPSPCPRSNARLWKFDALADKIRFAQLHPFSQPNHAPAHHQCSSCRRLVSCRLSGGGFSYSSAHQP